MSEEKSNVAPGIPKEDMVLHTYHMIMRLANEYDLSLEIEQINIDVNGDLDSICFDTMHAIQEDNVNKFYSNIFELFDFLSDLVFPDHLYISIHKMFDGIDITDIEVVMERRPAFVAELVTNCGSKNIRTFNVNI